MSKEIVQIYKQNRNVVESFIVSTISDIRFDDFGKKNTKNLFSKFRSLDIAYAVDKNWVQISPMYSYKQEDDSFIGTKKIYLSSKIKLKDNGTFLSNPYINVYSGKLSITYVKESPSGFIVLDLSLATILQRLGLLDLNYKLQPFSKVIYAFIASCLVMFSLFLAFYSLYHFFTIIFPHGDINLEITFKSIIALTLALAIFDLARTIFEQEVLSKALVSSQFQQNKTFSKFLISIVIALSIEALMVVFKIAIVDYTHMIHALYLIIGIALMIIAITFYNNTFVKKSR